MPLSPLPSPSPATAGRFDFGGVTVELASPSRRWRRLARRRYGSFATRRNPEWRADYRLTDPQLPSAAFLRDARPQPLCGGRQGERLELATETFEMRLDHGRGAAEVAGPLATYPVDRLIQTLWYETRHRGLMIHGAALVEGGLGWLASGPSGSGKSTLAALLPERALCEEFAAVELARSSEAAPRLAALPFWEGRSGGAELLGVYLLRHGERDRRRRLGAGEAFARLRREVVWPTYDPQVLERAFETLCELLGAVPICELAFRPRPEVWRLIRREAA